jgi:collagenase-like PrtC family protease
MPAGPATEARARRTVLAVVVGDPASLAAALRAGGKRVIVEASRLPRDTGALRGAWGPLLDALEEPWFRLPPIVHEGGADRAAIDRLRAAFPRACIVAGHLGQLALAREAGVPAAADLHLNAQNRRALEILRAAGARRVALDLEVDAREAAHVAGSAPDGVEVEVVIGGEVFSMLTRQPFGLAEGERLVAVSEHGHAYRFEATDGITTLFEARELIGAEALEVLAGRVHAVRLDLAHQASGAVEEIVGAYHAALERLLAEPDGAAAREAVHAAAETHRRHAPAGAFTGHLIRGSRLLDGAGGG